MLLIFLTLFIIVCFWTGHGLNITCADSLNSTCAFGTQVCEDPFCWWRCQEPNSCESAIFICTSNDDSSLCRIECNSENACDNAIFSSQTNFELICGDNNSTCINTTTIISNDNSSLSIDATITVINNDNNLFNANITCIGDGINQCTLDCSDSGSSNSHCVETDIYCRIDECQVLCPASNNCGNNNMLHCEEPCLNNTCSILNDVGSDWDIVCGPTNNPTQIPTILPTIIPTLEPSIIPTTEPSIPSTIPSFQPTAQPVKSIQLGNPTASPVSPIFTSTENSFEFTLGSTTPMGGNNNSGEEHLRIRIALAISLGLGTVVLAIVLAAKIQKWRRRQRKTSWYQKRHPVKRKTGDIPEEDEDKKQKRLRLTQFDLEPDLVPNKNEKERNNSKNSKNSKNKPKKLPKQTSSSTSAALRMVNLQQINSASDIPGDDTHNIYSNNTIDNNNNNNNNIINNGMSGVVDKKMIFDMYSSMSNTANIKQNIPGFNINSINNKVNVNNNNKEIKNRDGVRVVSVHSRIKRTHSDYSTTIDDSSVEEGDGEQVDLGDYKKTRAEMIVSKQTTDLSDLFPQPGAPGVLGQFGSPAPRAMDLV